MISWWCPLSFWEADCLAHGPIQWLAFLGIIMLGVLGCYRLGLKYKLLNKRTKDYIRDVLIAIVILLIVFCIGSWLNFGFK